MYSRGKLNFPSSLFALLSDKQLFVDVSRQYMRDIVENCTQKWKIRVTEIKENSLLRKFENH